MSTINAEYLKETVGKYLCQALCAVATRRPERPIEFLAYYLISLYEKDLQLQRAEMAAETKSEVKVDDFAVSPSREGVGPGPSSPADVFPVPSSASRMFVERLSISSPTQEKKVISPAFSAVGSMEAEPSPITSEPESPASVSPQLTSIIDEERSLTSDDFRKRSVSKDDKSGLLIPVIRTSTPDVPVSPAEEEQFGTTDPFLARRGTQLFDVSGSPIGNP